MLLCMIDERDAHPVTICRRWPEQEFTADTLYGVGHRVLQACSFSVAMRNVSRWEKRFQQ